jgi:hypothetical protein
MNKMTEQKKDTLIDLAIDLLLDIIGIDETIKVLLDNEFTRQELIDLNIDEADVDSVIAELGK